MNRYKRAERKRPQRPEPAGNHVVLPAGAAPVRPGGRGPSMPERTGPAPGTAAAVRAADWKNAALAGAAFAFFLMAACHKLTNSSLWFDEAIEYWYSKVMTGPLPFSDTQSMYERVVTTLQPPLYNFLLFFWLKISDTEWWFRFFGVVCGAVGMAGLWKTIRRAGGAAYLAAGAVCVCACCYRLAFYWQEAAEYCLMLGALFWTVYFWYCLVESPGLRYAILFTLSAIVPVYSQYGAVFPVAALAVSAWVCVLLARNLRALAELSIAYAVALLTAGLPLYFLYVKLQMPLQHGGAAVREITFENGFLRDFFGNLHTVFHWNLTPDLNGLASRFLLALILLAMLAVLIRGRRIARALTAANLLAWLVYYLAVKIGVYADMAYGGFGNRYNLFFLPLWIATGFVDGLELFELLSYLSRRFERVRGVQYVFAGAMAAFLACFAFATWNDRIAQNWVKDDIRAAVSHWYEEEAEDKATVVYYAANGGFSYYLRMNPAYTEDTERNVHYMHWYNDRSGAEYREYLNAVYGLAWPREIYLAADHYADDLFVILDQFAQKGYQRQDVYNIGEACLLRLTRSVR